MKKRHRYDERGATLVLALAFVILSGAILGALSTWISNDLRNTSNFSSAQVSQSALNSAVELAIQSIRYTPLIGSDQTLNANPPSYCWGSSPPSTMTLNGESISVWCSTVWNPTSATTRVVTFYACSSSTSVSSCAASPRLEAVVAFDDYDATGAVPTTSICTTTCGTSMAIESWTFAGDAPAQ